MNMITLVMANEPVIAQAQIGACVELWPWEASPGEMTGQLWLEGRNIEGEIPVSLSVDPHGRSF